MKNILYKDLDGKPKMEYSVCVYLDVLGFKEKTKECDSAEKLKNFFEKYSKTLDAGIEDLNSEQYDGPGTIWKVKVFTDNIVLGCPLRQEYDEIALAELAIGLSRFQLCLAINGYLVRGAMSYGLLCIDENYTFGPALVEAYELETNVAREPRIVISNTIRKLLLKHFGYYAEPQNAPQNEMYLLDEDGRIFVNYFYSFFEPLQYDDALDYGKLENHKKMVIDGLKRYEMNSRIWHKYFWLSKYHNYIIQSDVNNRYKLRCYEIDTNLFRIGPAKIFPNIVRRRMIDEAT